MEVGKLIGRILLGILLAVFLVGFAVTYSVSVNASEKNLRDVASDVVSQIYIEQIIKHSTDVESEDGIDFGRLYSESILECEGKDSITKGDDFEIDCSEIEARGEEGFENYIREKIDERISAEVEKELDIGGSLDLPFLPVVISIVKTVVFVFLILCIIMVFLMYLISSPKYKFGVDLGIVGIVVGLLFFPFNGLEISFGGTVENAQALNSLVSGIFQSLKINFLVLFIVGIVLLIVSLVWRHISKGISDGSLKKPGKKKDKAKDDKN